jgi:hypothetical protein
VHLNSSGLAVSIRLLRLDRIFGQPDASTSRNDPPGARSRWVTVSRVTSPIATDSNRTTDADPPLASR